MGNNNSKVVALVALIVAVVGLGIGFAAFSSTLTISSSATVTPNASTFSVIFDTTEGITCTSNGGATVTNKGTVSASTISGINIGFTQPGQYAICTATIKNVGEYIAYLNSITFDTLSCEKTDDTATDALVQDACDSITATLTVGGKEVISTKSTAGTDTNISAHTLAAKTGTETVSIKIEYAGPGRADGAFSVTIPTATLVYSSVD